MPRPNSISAIHELKYELRLKHLKPDEFAEAQGRYENAVQSACDEFHCTKTALLQTIAKDFGKWMRDEKLPPIFNEEK